MRISEYWWKILSFILIIYSIILGFVGNVPMLPNIRESIRNLYFHVPMWFTMMVMFLLSCVFALTHLFRKDFKRDIISYSLAVAGIIFGLLGLITGMEWATFTWGEPWSNDPKQLGSALCLLTYLAYLVLRNSMKDSEKKSIVAAVYNIFAFSLMIPFIWILPSITDSLHPGSGGNAGFNTYAVDNTMRMVFYPAIIGWILLGLWSSQILWRILILKHKIELK